MTTRTVESVATGRLQRMGKAPASAAVRQVLVFAAIGVASTVAYVALYALLRIASPAPVANAVALVATAVGNTAANRRLTFRVRGRGRLARDHAAGMVALAAALAITSAALAALDLVAPEASTAAEVAVLVLANAVATLVRFLVLRRALVGSRRRGSHRPADRSIGGSPRSLEGTIR